MKHKDAAKDKPMMRKVAKEEVGKHVKKMHGKKKKFAAGGKTNEDMLNYGRNMAKVINQKKPSFTYKSRGR
jgi:hypothetical protein